jgi:hypothetical protein
MRVLLLVTLPVMLVACHQTLGTPAWKKTAQLSMHYRTVRPLGASGEHVPPPMSLEDPPPTTNRPGIKMGLPVGSAAPVYPQATGPEQITP